jgi:hypothetical protein
MRGSGHGRTCGKKKEKVTGLVEYEQEKRPVTLRTVISWQRRRL